jgi:hypothetical protein
MSCSFNANGIARGLQNIGLESGLSSKEILEYLYRPNFSQKMFLGSSLKHTHYWETLLTFTFYT